MTRSDNVSPTTNPHMHIMIHVISKNRNSPPCPFRGPGPPARSPHHRRQKTNNERTRGHVNESCSQNEMQGKTRRLVLFMFISLSGPPPITAHNGREMHVQTKNSLFIYLPLGNAGPTIPAENPRTSRVFAHCSQVIICSILFTYPTTEKATWSTTSNHF